MSCCRGQGVSGARISGNLRAGQPFRWAAVCASGGKCVGWRRLAAGDARLSRLTSPKQWVIRALRCRACVVAEALYQVVCKLSWGPEQSMGSG